jgi:hypothetical protein
MVEWDFFEGNELGAVPLLALGTQRRLASAKRSPNYRTSLAPLAAPPTGTDILRATGNMRLVQKVLGHQHISTNHIYTHLADGDVRAAFGALEELWAIKSPLGDRGGFGVVKTNRL